MRNSDFVVYVDESGDHSLERINPQFPLFVLSFCVFRKDDFTRQVVPSIQEFKFKHFGHDLVILHEAEIRKQHGPFALLRDPNLRDPFLNELTGLMEAAPFTVIASAIKKDTLVAKYAKPEHVYHLAMEFGLERLQRFMVEQGQADRRTHVVVECRGAAEDKELELQFRRICDGQNFRSQQLAFEVIFADKKTNSSGLQLADLVARPIGRSILDPPERRNRAWEIIEKKLFVPKECTSYRGWGLKIFP